jgi:eukaryotic-like serine/threonine-protein kinase
MNQPSVRSAAREGDIIDYELGKELGKGGMGAVYLAKRKRDGKTVAIKTMLAKVAVDDYARAGFKREVDSTRSLSHPNIVTLYDFNYSGNLFFFALEYCEGGSIFDLMVKRQRALPLQEAGPMFLQALDGLAYAHEKGFVHRDLKPQNLLLTASTGGVAKVGDFGLAKSFEKAGLSGFTQTGEAAGTYSFMPKEQLTNYKYVKPPTDVWSMGATLYFMLTGELPRDTAVGQSPAEAVMRGQIVPIRKREPGVPKSVADVIDRALANKAADRYQNAAEFRDALQSVL